VTDTDGKPFVGATISIDRQGITQHFEVKTDNRGQYLHAGLPTGQYQISVMRDGKKAMTQPGVVRFGGDSAVDFDLKQAAAQGISEEARQKAAEEKAKAEATKASFEQARTAMISKNYDEAIKLFQEAADKDPTQHIISAQPCEGVSQVKKYHDGAKTLKKTNEIEPGEGALLNKPGIREGNAGKIDGGSKTLQKAAELNPPGAGQSYYNLG